HDSILRWFMKSDKSPTGRWYREVPVGIKRAINKMESDSIPENLERKSVSRLYSIETKKMDALCVKDSSNQLPLGWNESWISTKKVTPSPRDYMDVWRDRENSNINFDINFDGETIYIVEAKGRRKSQETDKVLEEAVSGNNEKPGLEKYAEFFLEDWEADLECLIVVAEDISIERAESLYPDIKFFLAEEMGF
ncbi:hypothetical protein AKJ64_03690, partial [candidate division MSBL1 archaeon SCGC-AAA259E17]